MSISEYEIAVLIPCRNEESTIKKVVEGFKQNLPEATVYVYDNASTDSTFKKAQEAEAEVVSESIPGKGQVVRRMFADTEADIYLLVDGDATYDPADAPLLVKTLFEGSYDMVTGSRTGLKENSRKGHLFGNKIFNRLYRTLFGSSFTDIFTGYRVLTRRFVKSFPAVSSGFEIEAELSVHASQLRLPVLEVPVSYGNRPEGSKSKLRTFSDGFEILKSMMILLKENRPLSLFGSIALLSFLTAVGISIPLIDTYAETGLVPRLPTAVLSTGLVLLSLLSLISGLILDSIAKARVEIKRLRYLQVPLHES
jgi:glycosyltransferase involved in cell wall biosynthesis